MEPEKIKEYSRGINYVHENIENNKHNQIKTILQDSKRIIFLGFGYDKRNIGKIEIDWTKVRIYGTTFNMTAGEVRKKFFWQVESSGKPGKPCTI